METDGRATFGFAQGGAGPSSIIVGAYLNVAVDPDRDAAHELVRGSVATFKRFSADSEAVIGCQKKRHGEAGAAFAQRLEDDFVGRFAVARTANEVRERLQAIRGCDHRAGIAR